MIANGVIHGRFQVMHNDHQRYMLAGKARCEHLVIGITNPDPVRTAADPVDPQRSQASANPLTYFERQALIRRALGDAGLTPSSYSIVPLPINFPDLFRYYVPLDATFFLTIYDAWGQRKLERFQSLGLKTEVLWERTPEEKAISGTDVRRRMATCQPWRHLVPPGVGELLEAWGVPERLREAAHAE